MFKLEERKKNRKHMHAVNSGEIVDTVASHGTAENGDVIGDDGKPVPGTAAKGAKPAEVEETDDNTNAGTDYTKFKSHADLNAELAKLNLETVPEGWTEDKPTIAEKQAKLAELTKPATQAWA